MSLKFRKMSESIMMRFFCVFINIMCFTVLANDNPPVKEGFVRVYHFTNASIEDLKKGLYSKNGLRALKNLPPLDFPLELEDQANVIYFRPLRKNENLETYGITATGESLNYVAIDVPSDTPVYSSLRSKNYPNNRTETLQGYFEHKSPSFGNNSPGEITVKTHYIPYSSFSQIGTVIPKSKIETKNFLPNKRIMNTWGFEERPRIRAVREEMTIRPLGPMREKFDPDSDCR